VRAQPSSGVVRSQRRSALSSFREYVATAPASSVNVAGR
jgi:hypothetical protein